MKKMIAVLAALIVGLIAAHAAWAYTCNASGCTFSVNYTEPATLTNGQALTDLAGCTAAWTKSTDGAAAVAQAPVAIPASKPQGGGAISKNISDATAGPPHVYTVQVTGVTCTSTAFGTSAPGAASNVLPMNNGTAPSPTQGQVTIQ